MAEGLEFGLVLPSSVPLGMSSSVKVDIHEPSAELSEGCLVKTFAFLPMFLSVMPADELESRELRFEGEFFKVPLIPCAVQNFRMSGAVGGGQHPYFTPRDNSAKEMGEIIKLEGIFFYKIRNILVRTPQPGM